MLFIQFLNCFLYKQIKGDTWNSFSNLQWLFGHFSNILDTKCGGFIRRGMFIRENYSKRVQKATLLNCILWLCWLDVSNTITYGNIQSLHQTIFIVMIQLMSGKKIFYHFWSQKVFLFFFYSFIFMLTFTWIAGS